MTSTIDLGPLAKSASGQSITGAGRQRAEDCCSIRQDAALDERQLPIPTQVTNHDEQLHPNFIGNFSKGLPHNSIGEVDVNSYDSLLSAAATGTPAAFESISLGGTVKLVNPLSGVAFDLEGTDSPIGHRAATGGDQPSTRRRYG